MKKTCFVIIGFGIKTDFETGRSINLDKTFENIIKPVFNEMDILCYRACDIEHSRVIDTEMYENIMKADFVVADISTLNPNAIYELGIRHALRPNTTIVIGEDKLKIPFDVNHIVIHKYEHLESDIGYSEVTRFREVLKNLVESLIENPKVDSPVYTFLPKLSPPLYTDQEIEEIEEEIERTDSAAHLVEKAEREKNSGNYEESKTLLKEALNISSNDDFITQRLALVTYKSKLPDEHTALIDALDILENLNPKTTTDPETLGLLGAIYKRLFEIDSQNIELLNKSIEYYERGYYVKQDYYNGINVAYLYCLKSSLSEVKLDIYSNYGQAIKVWKNLNLSLNEVIKDDSFSDRGDRVWIYLTLAETSVGLNTDDERMYFEKAQGETKDSFPFDSYNTQRDKLLKMVGTVKDKIE